MRKFRDGSGREWDVTIGRESWGTFVLIFTLRGGPEVRKRILSSESHVAAEQELQALGDGDLVEALAASEPWA